MSKLVKKVLETAYHRNGVCGVGFHLIRFISDPDGKDEQFLATVFVDGDGEEATSEYYAVVSLDRIPQVGVQFMKNSWRGDKFIPELMAVIRENRRHPFNREEAVNAQS